MPAYRLITLAFISFVVASCGVSEGPSLLGTSSATAPSLAPPPPSPPVVTACSPGQYDVAGTCTDVGAGFYAGSNGARMSCSAPPAHAFHTSARAPADPCPWSCDDGYLSNGTTCQSFPNAKALSCAAGEVAVGFYGQSGAIVDAIGIRCAPLANGVITGPPVDRTAGYYGGTGGNSFNANHAADCPANSYLAEIEGVNCNWAYAPGNTRQTAELHVRCRDLTTGTLSGFLPSNPGWGTVDGSSACTNDTTFNFSCGSPANPSGTYIGGYIINTNSGAAFVGEGLGISCH